MSVATRVVDSPASISVLHSRAAIRASSGGCTDVRWTTSGRLTARSADDAQAASAQSSGTRPQSLEVCDLAGGDGHGSGSGRGNGITATGGIRDLQQSAQSQTKRDALAEDDVWSADRNSVTLL